MEAVGNDDTRDPRSQEPWWNNGCEDMYQQVCEARITFEKNPSLETSKAFRRLQRQFKKKVMAVQSSYAYRMQMSSERFGPELPPMKENGENLEIQQKKVKKKKKKAAKDDGSESEGDNLDLSQEIYPLSHYVSDQEELVNQMFSIIKGPKLEAMLPPALRSIPLHELKSLCLHELRGMSKKRIHCAINGQDMEGSSESEEDEDTEKPANTNTHNKENTMSPMKKKKNNVDKSAEKTDDQRGLPAYLMKTIKVEGHDEDGSGDKGSTSGKKSVLELLELQMRARIIKTMLEKNDGKAITEDALLALMESADQTAIGTQIASEIQNENNSRVTDAKDTEEGKEIKEAKESERKKSNGGRRLKDSSKSSRSEHKKEPHHRRGSKRHRSTDIKESDDDNDKRSRKDRSSDKRQQKKKKITRREFEERMKRAKKNRSYRQRRSSEDELKSSAGKNKDVSEDLQVNKAGKVKEENADGSKAKEEGENASEKEEGEAISEKEEGEAASEKEEGECDTDDEEDGACSPSDISSASYSSRSYTSRSRSRSYSRSYSRSPVRRRGSGRGKSRSWTRSRSRSRSIEKRRDSGRWSKRKPRDHGSSGNLKMSTGIVSLPNSTNQKPPKEEEDNWGQSCDIEFVDSEEDFDDNATDSAKNTDLDSKKPLPMKGQNSDRASISFSFQKKNVPSITPNVDLDDLPLKSNSLGIVKNRRNSDVELIPAKEEPKQTHIINLDSPVKEDEILISSDSEQETKDLAKTKSVRVERRELIPSAAKYESPRKEVTVSAPKNSSNSSSDFLVADENIPTSKDFSKKDSETGTELSVDAHSEASSEKSSLESSKPKEEACSNNINTANIEEQEDGDLPEIKEKDTGRRVDETKENCSRHEENMYEETENENILNESSNVDEVINENQGDFSQNDDITENKDNRTANEKTDISNQRPEHGKISDVAEELCTPKQDTEPAVCDSINDVNDKQDSFEQTNIKDENSVSVADDKQSTASDSEENKCTDKIKETPSNTDSIQEHHRDIRRKIVLEHLQESYNEDEGFNIHDPCSQNTDILASEVNTQESNADSVKKISKDDECTKEIISTAVKENYELHDKVLTEDHKVVEVEKENTSFDKSEGNVEDIQENECHEETQGTSDDFYRGADQLSFSDEDTGNLDEEDLRDIRNKEVEPIRINTGLIRKRVTRSKKMEMVAPAKSWTKKERRKKEKPKDLLAMEGIGLLKQSLAENVQSPLSKDDPQGIEGKEEEQMNDDDTCTSWGVSSISSKEETSMDSRPQSPKESEIQISGDSPKSGNDETSEAQDMSVGSKKSGQETEIIGVIEASSTLDNSQLDDIDVGGSSWSMRWLQSEKVQKVVSSSKMLSRVRKKIQKKEKATKVAVTEKPEPPIKKLPEPVVPIIGSIEEYERLFGMKAKKTSDETANAPDESTQENVTSGGTSDAVNPTVDEQKTHQSPKKRATFGSDDEGEDSEEEALWSKILGK